MQLLAIIVLSASELPAGLQLWPSATVDGIRAASSKAGAASEVEKYRVFMYAADTYMKSSPPSVSVTTSVDWSTIKTLTTLPASVRATEMPSGWRIVRAVDNTWVACTQLSAKGAEHSAAEGDAARAGGVRRVVATGHERRDGQAADERDTTVRHRACYRFGRHGHRCFGGGCSTHRRLHRPRQHCRGTRRGVAVRGTMMGKSR